MNDERQTPPPAGLNPGFDGMDAKRAGLSVEACPYQEPGPQRTAWVVGWYIAERDKQAG